MQTISIGSNNNDVRVLQEKLKTIGYYSGTIDSDFGPVTDSAVRAFQSANGLYVDGVVGPVTWPVIMRLADDPSGGTIMGDTIPVSEIAKGETGRWHGHIFVVSPDMIRSFTDLQIKAGVDLDTSDEESAGYATFKNSKPKEINLTVHFNAHTGCDVRKEVIDFVNDAGTGTTDYLYIGGQKLVTEALMLISATTSQVVISSGNTWVSAQVALSFKQSEGGIAGASNSGNGAGSSGGGGGAGYSGGYSGSNKTTVAQQGFVQTAMNRFNTAKEKLANSKVSSVATGNATIKKLVSAVKNYSANKVKATTSAVGGSTKKVNATK